MVKELMQYLWKQKAWWLAPSILLLLLFGALITLSAMLPVSPFIYMLF